LKLYLYICKRSQQQLYNCIDTTGSRNCTATIQTIRKFWIANSHTRKQPIRNRYDLSSYSFLQTSETSSRIQRGGKAWSELKEWDSSLFKHFIKQLLCMFELTAIFVSISLIAHLQAHRQRHPTRVVLDLYTSTTDLLMEYLLYYIYSLVRIIRKRMNKKKKTQFLFSNFVSTGY
jgi:hypothetical protein